MKRTEEEIPEQVQILSDIVEEEKLIFGPDHPNLIATIGNLSTAYSMLPGGETLAYELAREVLLIASKWRDPGHPQLVQARNAELILRPGVTPSKEFAIELKAIYEEALEFRGPASNMAQKCLRDAVDVLIDLGDYSLANQWIAGGLKDSQGTDRRHNRFGWLLTYLEIQILQREANFDLAEKRLNRLIVEAAELEGETSDAFQQAVVSKAELRYERGLDLSEEEFPELHQVLRTWIHLYPDGAAEFAESIGLSITATQGNLDPQPSVRFAKRTEN